MKWVNEKYIEQVKSGSSWAQPVNDIVTDMILTHYMGSIFTSAEDHKRPYLNYVIPFHQTVCSLWPASLVQPASVFPSTSQPVEYVCSTG